MSAQLRKALENWRALGARKKKSSKSCPALHSGPSKVPYIERWRSSVVQWLKRLFVAQSQGT